MYYYSPPSKQENVEVGSVQTVICNRDTSYNFHGRVIVNAILTFYNYSIIIITVIIVKKPEAKHD